MMDDGEVLDDLSSLVNEAPHAPDEPVAAHRTLDIFEDLLEFDSGEGVAGPPADMQRQMNVMWPEHFETRVANRREVVVVRFPAAAAVLVLLLCIVTGAGVSALVFHDRVSDLLALWAR